MLSSECLGTRTLVHPGREPSHDGSPARRGEGYREPQRPAGTRVAEHAAQQKHNKTRSKNSTAHASELPRVGLAGLKQAALAGRRAWLEPAE
jgi:hypothetical protein